MEKLLFLVPNPDTARAVVDTLEGLGVPGERVGVLANDSARIEDLPDADVEDHSDVVPAFARGAAAGGVTGLLAGLAVIAFPAAGLVAGGAALVATTTLGGAGFGAFASALVGTSVDNSQLREYEEAIGRGEILVIVEIEEGEEREREIKAALAAAHPSLSSEGKKDAPPIL